jgi:protein SCO1
VSPGPTLWAVPPRVLLALMTLTLCLAAGVLGVVLARLADDPAPASTGWEGATRPPGAVLPDFALTDQDGEPVTAADLRGRTTVVTFMYSTCEDTCPAQAQSIRGALDRLGRDVPVIAVSVDPANDTPRRARTFLLEQSMTGRMRFLLGTHEQLAPIWTAFGIAPQRDGREHSAYTVLVDGEGRQRIGFPAARLTPRALAADLARLT